MTQARNRLISLADTPYYHCIGRCVRRAFLCGTDTFSGKNYEHRRQWIVDKLQQLTQVFAIDVCSYAVMSNHYHVVLKLNPASAKAWTDSEVVERWTQLFKGNEHTRAFLSGDELSLVDKACLRTQLPLWKERLTNLSWFMRCLNESIAKRANLEDNCTGRFWEGRFKSQALLDETALISCMAYVDLNPIRAGIASTPEQSDYTSIQTRIKQRALPKDSVSEVPSWLLPMVAQADETSGIPLDLDNYLALVDWTGRAQRVDKDKSGRIPNQLAPLLNRLALDDQTWLNAQRHFGKSYCLAIGASRQIRALATKVGRQWLAGQGTANILEFG